MMVELNNFPLQRYQCSFMGWSHASSHLPCAGTIPARGPPFCLMDASEHVRTHTHTQNIMRTLAHKEVKTRAHTAYTLWHLSSCCALRTWSNILQPSTPLSIQLLSLSLSFHLCHKPFSATSSSSSCPTGGLSLNFLSSPPSPAIITSLSPSSLSPSLSSWSPLRTLKVTATVLISWEGCR